MLDLAATAATAGTSPAIIGINSGHSYPNGSNWQQWMQRLGVNSARVFLDALWGSTLSTFVGSATWGTSLAGTAVTNLSTFSAAVAALRAPAGRSPASIFANPVQWAKFDRCALPRWC